DTKKNHKGHEVYIIYFGKQLITYYFYIELTLNTNFLQNHVIYLKHKSYININ
ncbi:hypothetical protein M2448_004082, partial [Dysgonomonas sp. PF1-14]|nr:hypothetical protein [Dysgonomonas sp. PF1-14]MDH6341022.1 hypothetical protein [Dysgonomonas sp. PF1-16]MDH6399989.1 hypothetical protein [Dysgonomonas sp. PF1-23]